MLRREFSRFLINLPEAASETAYGFDMSVMGSEMPPIEMRIVHSALKGVDEMYIGSDTNDVTTTRQ